MKKVIVTHHHQPADQGDPQVPGDEGLGTGGHRRHKDAEGLSPGARRLHHARGAGEIRQAALRRHRLELHPAAQFRSPLGPRYESRHRRRGGRRQHSPGRLGRGSAASARKSRSIITKPTCRPSIRWAPPIIRICGTAAIRCNCCPSGITARKTRKTRACRHPGRFLERRSGHRRDLPHGARAGMRFRPGCFPMASNKMAPFNSQNTFLRGARA